MTMDCMCLRLGKEFGGGEGGKTERTVKNSKPNPNSCLFSCPEAEARSAMGWRGVCACDLESDEL